jgi:hypothetical protein
VFRCWQIFCDKIQPEEQRRRGDFLQNPQGLNLQRRKNTKYTFAPANRSDSAPLSGTQPIVEEIIKGKD